MKSKFAILIALLFAAASCQQNARTAAEVETKPQTLEAQTSQLDTTQTGQSAEIPFNSSFYIDSKNVILRASNSAQSAKIGTFKQWEEVTVFQIKSAQNTNEAVLKESVLLSTASGERIQVPAGRAVRLGQFKEAPADCQVTYADTYAVTFDHPSKGTLSGDVSTDQINSDNLWYQVRRANGTRGWVFGKYVAEGPLVGEECGL